jgi:hypothetical protein
MAPYSYHMQVVILRHLLYPVHGSLLLPNAGGYCKTPSLSCPWIPTPTICRRLFKDTSSVLPMAPYSYHMQVVIVRHLLYPVHGSLLLQYAGGESWDPSHPILGSLHHTPTMCTVYRSFADPDFNALLQKRGCSRVIGEKGLTFDK